MPRLGAPQNMSLHVSYFHTVVERQPDMMLRESAEYLRESLSHRRISSNHHEDVACIVARRRDLFVRVSMVVASDRNVSACSC
jgi:hypothetical protein